MRGRRSGSETFALIAGGGTAGHVVPALAIARALVRRGVPSSAVRFAGSRRGMEATMVPAAGFPVTLLPGRGVPRRLSLKSASAVVALGGAFLEAVALLARMRPAVVVSVGGYASLAPALAAGVMGVPLVLVNFDAVANSANRLVSRFATASAVAFDGTALPRATWTGMPVRDELAALDRSPEARRSARRELGLPEGRFTVAVMSGSLGARRVNEAVVDLAHIWAGRDDLAIYHVIGRRDWPDLAASVPPAAGGLAYSAVAYEERMPLVLAAADVFVGRAGASTVAELAAAGLPSILIPLPGAPGDHQGANAAHMCTAGAARVVEDADCTGERLAAELAAMAADGAVLAEMGRRASALARPDAADAVAQVVWASAGRRAAELVRDG